MKIPKLPKINISDPKTFRTIVFAGLGILLVLAIIFAILFPSRGPAVPPTFDPDRDLIVKEFGENTVIIETLDPEVTDPEVLRQLAGIPEDKEIIVDIPGAGQKDNFDENPYYYKYQGDEIEPGLDPERAYD